MEDAVDAGLQPIVAPVTEKEPVDRAIEDAPYHVLAHLVAAVGRQILPEIVAGAAGGNLGDQLGGSLLFRSRRMLLLSPDPTPGVPPL